MILNISSTKNFLESIAELIIKHDYKDIKIILPTSPSCNKLQQILVSKSENESCILPQIVPIINLGIGSENIYQIPSEFTQPISRLEQRIIIARIIKNIDNHISIAQALDLSFHVMRLFDELTDFTLDITELEKKILLNQSDEFLYNIADHWRERVSYIEKIYYEWKKILDARKKIDFSQYRQNIIRLEIAAAKNNSYIHILAGIFPKGPLMQELAHILARSQNSYFIPPPMDVISTQESSENFSHKTHYYYQIKQILDDFCLAPRLRQEEKERSADIQVEYKVAENLRIESELIVNKILEWRKLDKEPSIALVIKNDELINMCCNLLNSHMIAHINFNGYSIEKTKPYEFFILLREAYDDKHGIDIAKYITLLKTHYLFSEEVAKFELDIRKNGIIGHSNIMDHLKSFDNSLKSHIEIAEKLAKNLWNSVEGRVLSDFLYELLQIENIDEFIKEDYIGFIKSIAKGARYHKNLTSQQVIFMPLEDANLGGYQYVIFGDMNEGSIPLNLPPDPWMNTKMRENIGLSDMAEKIGIEWYHFKNLLQRKNIFITRSEKKAGKETETSRFLQELISIGALNATQ